MSTWRTLVLVVVALLVGAGVAGAIARHLHRGQLAGEFSLASHDGPTFMLLAKKSDALRQRKELWAWAKAEHLAKRLQQEWIEGGNDHYWGIAYAVVRDKGWQTWTWAPGLDQATEDEIIRYLCFRIEAGSPVLRGNDLHTEFKALASYPAGALARGAPILRRALLAAMKAPDEQLVFWAQDFVIAQVEQQEWARALVQEYYRVFHFSSREAGCFSLALRNLLLSLLRRAGEEGPAARQLLRDFAALYRESRDEFPKWNGVQFVADECMERLRAGGMLAEPAQQGP